MSHLDRARGFVSEPARRGATALASGRRLSWSEWGPLGGVPVLFCPGAGTSSLLGFGASVVDALGIRLVAVDRPGLGASDPAPERTLDAFASDVRELALAQSLPEPRVVGYSQGAPFALACAAANVVSRVAIVAGTDELAAPHLTDLLVPDVRRLIELVAADPAQAEAMFRTMTADTMREMVLTMSGEIDRAIYRDSAFDETYRRALAEGFSQGSDGYARDTVLAMSRWPFDPARITVPVTLWYGEKDASPVHSPDFGASLSRRIPGAQRMFMESEGGAILWTRAEEILASLVPR